MRRLILAALCALALPSAAAAQVAFVTGTTAAGLAVSSLDSSSITVGSESNRVLIATVMELDNGSDVVSGLSWDPSGANEAFTACAAEAAASGGQGDGRAWYLVNPSSATAAVRLSGSGTLLQVGFSVVLYSGADQTTPCADQTVAGGTADTGTVTVPNTAADGFVQDHIIINAAGLTVGANQTLIGSATGTGGPSTVAGSRQDGTDGGVMSYDITSNLGEPWGIVGVRIVAAAAGGGTPCAMTLLGAGKCE